MLIVASTKSVNYNPCMTAFRTFAYFILLLNLLSIAPVHSEDLDPVDLCGMNQQAADLALLIIDHADQQRPVLQCNQLLAEIAQQRAEQLANNSADPEITPNQVLIKGGFRAADYYPVSGNQVEAVVRDLKNATLAMEFLRESGKHNDHVLGKGEFFALQNQIGVGFYQDDDPTNHDQWVVLIAEPWRSPKVVFKQEFTMPFKMATGCDQDWENGNDEFLKRKCRSLGKQRKKVEKKTQLKCDANHCELDD